MELVRLTKLTQRMWEIEALLDGFCATLQAYKDKGEALQVSDVDYLHRKQDRILSYIQILPSEINNINQLPIDYWSIFKDIGYPNQIGSSMLWNIWVIDVLKLVRYKLKKYLLFNVTKKAQQYLDDEYPYSAFDQHTLASKSRRLFFDLSITAKLEKNTHAAG